MNEPTAYEQQGLLQRIEALEEDKDKLKSFDIAQRERIDVVERRLHELEEIAHRVEALEKRWSDPPTWKTFEAALNRIEALEAERSALTHNQATHAERIRRLEESLIWSAARERQERWHRTRDAALVISVVQRLKKYEKDGQEYVEDTYLDVGATLALAAEFADRAHGPLEAKATSLNELTPKLVEAHANYFLKERAEQVEALVRAARAIDETALSQALTAHEWKELVMGLRATLKPFEGVK